MLEHEEKKQEQSKRATCAAQILEILGKLTDGVICNGNTHLCEPQGPYFLFLMDHVQIL